MDRNEVLKKDSKAASLFGELVNLHQHLEAAFRKQFNRSLPVADEIVDRWERAKTLGFGEGSSIYDSSYVFGDVKVGQQTWIGPFTIIDGSGGLEIGKHCTISAGVHIYTHDNVSQTLTGGLSPIERQPVRIGEYTYVGPHAVIRKGVSIGSHCIIGTASYITRDIPANSVVVGVPGKIIGKTIVTEGKLNIEYFKD